jgi:NAD(P)-dependent dehydrogenase (short-subunit alcohol dehydrogenase family)
MAASTSWTGSWWPRRRELAGLRAIVTGGSSGVGRAVALELARRGSLVLATARRSERLAKLAAEPALAAPIRYLAGDLCEPAFRQALVTAAAERFGGLDLVVAAAGAGAIGPFRSADPATLERILALDLVAPAELVRTALPHLTRGRDPAIVLVGTIGFITAYTVSGSAARHARAAHEVVT